MLTKQQWNKEQEDLVGPAIKVVEEALKSSKTLPIYIAATKLHLPNERARDLFKSLVTSAGWSVTYTSDQRDGDFWKIQ